MKIKNLLIITILLLILLCFSQYSNKFYNKIKYQAREFFNNMINDIQKIELYPNLDNNYDVENKLTNRSNININNSNLKKINFIFDKITQNNAINKSYKKEILSHNKNDVNEKELGPIVEFFFKKINGFKLNDGSINKIKLSKKIDKNDVYSIDLKDGLFYKLTFTVSYFSNFYDNIKNGDKLKKIDDLIISTDIIKNKNKVSDIFIDNNYEIISLEIIGTKSGGDYLPGYDKINDKFKYLETSSVNNKKFINLLSKMEPSKNFKKKYGVDKLSSTLHILDDNKTFGTKKYISDETKKLLISDINSESDIDSLLPDSYVDPSNLVLSSSYDDTSEAITSSVTNNKTTN
jgi:hypothetical protein